MTDDDLAPEHRALISDMAKIELLSRTTRIRTDQEAREDLAEVHEIASKRAGPHAL